MAQHRIGAITFALGKPGAPRPRLDRGTTQDGDFHRRTVLAQCQALDLRLKISEHVQPVCMLREDEHAATGTGLLSRPLGKPAMVRQDGLGRQCRWAVGLTRTVALHGHRLPRSQGIGQGRLEVAAEGIFAACLLDDRLAFVNEPSILLGQPRRHIKEDYALAVGRQLEAHLFEQDEDELALHNCRQFCRESTALLDPHVGGIALTAERLGILFDHLRGDRIENAEPLDERLLLVPAKRLTDEDVVHALEHPVGRAGLPAVRAAGQPLRAVRVAQQPTPDPSSCR